MISFESDYTTGAHPRILQRLLETNLEPVSGYGADPYCQSAKEKIKQACDCQEAQITFLTGGTQTNAVVIASILQDYEGVIAAKTGHISTHESGAIEYTGHKVLELDQVDGKITAQNLSTYLEEFYKDESQEHMVYPGMVYLSHPTEYGTLYGKEELQELAKICKSYHIPLYIDGARLGYALTSEETDVTLPDLASLCDVFYIGGTKVGALCGEAVVFTKGNQPKHFLTSVKKRGALLAKGRLLGVQFDTLFTEDLYLEISKHAIQMSLEIKDLFESLGIRFFVESPTNQQFVILENETIERLKKDVVFSVWEPYDETHTVVRFVTSWSTTIEEIETLKKIF